MRANRVKRIRRTASAIGVSAIAFFELCLTGEARLGYRLANREPVPPHRQHGRLKGFSIGREGQGCPDVLKAGEKKGKDHAKFRSFLSRSRANRAY